MTNLILAGLAATLLAQTPATPTPVGPGAPTNLDIPELEGTTADPTCGARPAIAQQAFCVSTTQAAMESIADRYNAAFSAQGWMAADGENNRIIYVKRKDEGGCLAFQLLAFADETRPPAPAAPGYFAFATIPGDVCAAQPPETPSAQ